MPARPPRRHPADTSWAPPRPLNPDRLQAHGSALTELGLWQGPESAMTAGLALIAGTAGFAIERLPWIGAVRINEVAMIGAGLAGLGSVVCLWQSYAAGRAALRRRSPA